MDVSRHSGKIRTALGLSLACNIILIGVIAWTDSEPPDTISAPATPLSIRAESKPLETPKTLEEPAEVAAETEPEAPQVELDKPLEGVQVTRASIKGSIPQTMALAAKPYGDYLSATLSRLLVWDMDLRRDLRAGDTIATSWHLGTTDTVVIESLRFHSQKLERTMNAYQFQASGDKYPSYWTAEGVEVPHKLKKSPLAEYEQITSLLKDRPNHKGMDFKAEVGTPVLGSFNGVVTRVNWNWKANGNCLEVRHDDGVLAKYLHLSENKVKAGDRVVKGQVIALTGNTGRSTGPHLHYQLNRGKKVVDAIKYDGTFQRSLPEGDREGFSAIVKSANTLLGTDITL